MSSIQYTKKIALIDCNSFYVSCERLFNPKIRTFMKLTIPYYLHKAGAGFPSPATDYIEEDIDLNVHLIKNVPATFIIRVQGKSMVDVGINDGDLLVVDKSLTSGSKEFTDRILINEDEDIFIWGVVTYVIHSVY